MSVEWKPPARLLNAAFLEADANTLDRFLNVALSKAFGSKTSAAPNAVIEFTRQARACADVDYKIFAVLVLAMLEPAIYESIERNDVPQIIRAFFAQEKNAMDLFLTGLKPADGGKYSKDFDGDQQQKTVPYFVSLMRRWYLSL